MCCNSWCRKELDMTEPLNNNKPLERQRKVFNSVQLHSCPTKRKVRDLKKQDSQRMTLL